MDPALLRLDLDVRDKLRSDGKLHNKFIPNILIAENAITVKSKLLIPHIC